MAISKISYKAGVSYRVQVTKRGKVFADKTFQTLAQARGYQAQKKQELRLMGADAVEASFQSGGLMLRVLMAEKLEQDYYSETTRRADRSRFECLCSVLPENLRLDSLTTVSVRQCFESLNKKRIESGKKTLSRATLERYKAFLSSTYRYARTHYNYQGKNPIEGLELPRPPREKRRVVQTSVIAPSLGQSKYIPSHILDEFVFEAREMSKSYRTSNGKVSAVDPRLPFFVEILRFTAMRAGELDSFSWETIFALSKGFSIQLTITKNGRSRVIPQSKQLTKVCGELLSLQGNDSSDALVFRHSSINDRMFDYWTELRKVFKHKYDGKQLFRIHDIRHTTITDMYRHNIPHQRIRELAGHLSEKVHQSYVDMLGAELKSESQVTLPESMFGG